MPNDGLYIHQRSNFRYVHRRPCSVLSWGVRAMTDLDTKALEAAARAVYAVLPNFGMEWQLNTAGGRSKVRVNDSWEDAPDRHEDCTRQAQAAIEAYLAATPSRNDILEEAARVAETYMSAPEEGDSDLDNEIRYASKRIADEIRALVKP